MTTVTPRSERQERQEREEQEERAQLVRLARQHLLERDLNLARQDWHDHWQERNRHARHPLGVPLGAELHLDRMEAPLTVQLVDVSLGGVCLLTSPVFHLHRGQRGLLCCSGVHHPLVGDLESRRVRICWVETREWLSVVGVAFDEGLPA